MARKLREGYLTTGLKHARSLWISGGIVPWRRMRMLGGPKAGRGTMCWRANQATTSQLSLEAVGTAQSSREELRGTRKQQQNGQHQAFMILLGQQNALTLSILWESVYSLSKLPWQTDDETWARLMFGFRSSVFLTTNTSREEEERLALGGEKTAVKRRPMRHLDGMKDPEYREAGFQYSQN